MWKNCKQVQHVDFVQSAVPDNDREALLRRYDTISPQQYYTQQKLSAKYRIFTSTTTSPQKFDVPQRSHIPTAQPSQDNAKNSDQTCAECPSYT